METERRPGGFWDRQWAEFETRMLRWEARDRGVMPLFGRRWWLFQALVVSAGVRYWIDGIYLVPVLAGVYLLVEGSEVVAELRRRRDTAPSVSSSDR
jgi:hypothetical protein